VTLRVHVEGDDRIARSVRRVLRGLAGVALTTRDPALVIARGSRVRPTLTLDRAVIDGDESRAATRMGASIIAWEGRDQWSHWQQCLAPLTERPLRGAPDASLRWALVDHIDLSAIPAHPEPGWQWHALVGARERVPRHVVQWRARAGTAARLLGASAAVVGREGALVEDAWRLGRPALAPVQGEPLDAWAAVTPPACAPRLAHAIPPLLAAVPSFWEALITSCAGAGPVPPVLTATAVRDAREAALRAEAGPRGALLRELRRLGEDPFSAIRDARLWAVRKLWSSARAPADGSYSTPASTRGSSTRGRP
jgi:hypothetical protein